MKTFKKQNYLAPLTEVLYVRQEMAFLGSVTIEELPTEEEYDF